MNNYTNYDIAEAADVLRNLIPENTEILCTSECKPEITSHFIVTNEEIDFAVDADTMVRIMWEDVATLYGMPLRQPAEADISLIGKMEMFDEDIDAEYDPAIFYNTFIPASAILHAFDKNLYFSMALGAITAEAERRIRELVEFGFVEIGEYNYELV